MVAVYLSLGSNLGVRADNLRAAIAALTPHLTAIRCSSLYETAPMYVADQPAFLNLALAAETSLSPRDLLCCAKAVEQQVGRLPSLRFGPRAIDVDIIYHGATLLVEEDLIIPHPRRAERAFVLVPLAEIAADFIDPELGKPVGQLAEAVPGRDTVQLVGPLPPPASS